MLDKIAQALLEHETIGEKHFEALFSDQPVDWDSIHEAGLLEDESKDETKPEDQPAPEGDGGQPE